MKVDTLILTKSLGKGAFGEVFLTKKEGNDKELYATKRMDRSESENPSNKKRLINEIGILSQIKHPNIVRLIELKKTKNHIYIVTEYCNGGSLSDNLKNYITKYKRPFTEEIVQYLMRQIVSAINYLHTNRIIHRDLKLDNILVHFPSEDDKQDMLKAVAKLIDFGFATKLNKNRDMTKTVLGTPANMEPHLISDMEKHQPEKEGYNEKVDIWSLGTLCYEMLTGRLTFFGKNMNELFEKVKIGNYKVPLWLSKEAVSFLNGMLQYDANKRLSSEELLKHDFLTKNVKLFQPVDAEQLKGKIQGQNIRINIMNNNTIWGIFNADGKDNNNNDKPLEEDFEPMNNLGNFENKINNNDEEKNKNNNNPVAKVTKVSENEIKPEINNNMKNEIKPSQRPMTMQTQNKPPIINPQHKTHKVRTLPFYHANTNKTYDPKSNNNIIQNNQFNQINSNININANNFNNNNNVSNFTRQQSHNIYSKTHHQMNQKIISQTNVNQKGQISTNMHNQINKPEMSKGISYTMSKEALNEFY